MTPKITPLEKPIENCSAYDFSSPPPLKRPKQEKPPEIIFLDNHLKSHTEKNSSSDLILRDSISSIHRLGQLRDEITLEELGAAAGTSVIDQFNIANAEVSSSLRDFSSLAICSTYEYTMLLLPFAALGAGVALDIAIFGGAAESLAAANPFFDALCVGSLVFAAGIGIVEGLKKKQPRFAKAKKLKLFQGFSPKAFALHFLMAGASIGASFLAADNKDFKDHFANALPASFTQTVDAATTTENSATGAVDTCQATLDQHRNELKDYKNQLVQNGSPEFPLTVVQKRTLRQYIKEYNEKTIPADTDALKAAKEKASAAETNKNSADVRNPASWWGRIIGTGYLSLWLIASQIVTSTILSIAPELTRRIREKLPQKNFKRQFVNALKNRKTRAAAAKENVRRMLLRFNDALADAAKNDPEKQKRFAKLLGGKNFAVALDIGVQNVCEAFETSVTEIKPEAVPANSERRDDPPAPLEAAAPTGAPPPAPQPPVGEQQPTQVGNIEPSAPPSANQLVVVFAKIVHEAPQIFVTNPPAMASAQGSSNVMRQSPLNATSVHCFYRECMNPHRENTAQIIPFVPRAYPKAGFVRGGRGMRPMDFIS